MKKYHIISIVIVIIIVILLSIFLFNRNSVTKTQGNIVILPLVKGCAETENGMATRAVGQEKEATIEVFDDKITYYRAINHQCCRKVVLEKKVEDSMINIYEVWSGEGCRCICFSEISADLKGLEKGKYIVNIYETGSYPNGEPMEEKLILSKNIEVK